MKKFFLLLPIIMISTFHLLNAQERDTHSNTIGNNLSKAFSDTLNNIVGDTRSNSFIDTLNSCPMNIEDIENNSVLSVFPNPSEGIFQIIYGSTTSCPPAGWGGMLIIRIINSRYETVYSETILVFDGEYNRTIDFRTMEKGIYIIELAVGRRFKVKRELLR